MILPRTATAALAVALGTVLAAAATTGAAGDTTASIAALPDVTYIAHRGGSMEARENSLSGLRHAVDSGAVQVLDMDTRVLRDGTVAVMHDPTVDRVSTSRGPVAAFTPASWADIRLDIGSWLRPTPPPEAPPTLAHVLNRFGGSSVLTVELKDGQTADTVARMLEDRNLTGSVFVNTNSPSVAHHVHDLGLKTQLWRSAAQMRGDDPRQFASYVDVFDLDIDATAADFRRFVDTGVNRIWAHTVTTRAERNRALDRGANGIITDDPGYLTGRRDTYPLVPTTIEVRQSPAAVQVSDRTRAEVLVIGESGPAIPEAPVTVSGRSVTATTTSTPARGLHWLRLDTTGARVGGGPVTIAVPAGRAGERRWRSGSAAMAVRLVHEDLAIRPTITRTDRRLAIGVRLLDSAAAAYQGAGHETGAGRTVAGLSRARLFLTVARGGRVLHTAVLDGVDTGADDGDGRVRFSWTAPRAGTYVVTVAQHGSTYRRSSVTREVTVP